jgi:DNA sulfur modification protein DndC
MTPIRNKKVEGIIAEIIDQYAYADTSDRPWIIGFSGIRPTNPIFFRLT